MSLIQCSSVQQPLNVPVENVVFPSVVAIPSRESMPEGELYTFSFQNGYGAHLIQQQDTKGLVFEFCVLTDMRGQPRPDFTTPVAKGVLTRLSYHEVQKLLVQTEELPTHQAEQTARARLLSEKF